MPAFLQHFSSLKLWRLTVRTPPEFTLALPRPFTQIELQDNKLDQIKTGPLPVIITVGLGLLADSKSLE
jgi:hypothetical protein